ncbi:MAG: glycosyltransferase family 4 protein [Patescibacteria group bacterium]|nr:glycosyltransferase family 4 protein [Patescibacteria group bacterium]
MKLLIITQIVDRQDPVLGFFHHWVEELAEQCDLITFVGLRVGEYCLPDNVEVLSLGKEAQPSRLKYIWRFCKHIWQKRNNYDAVFVHMNQEYILLAGWWWRLIGKRVTMWRNHHSGSLLTDIAAMFCNRVFCTSKYSYTAKYKKTVLMPVGIDLNLFKPDPNIKRVPRSILFLARLAPSKRPHLFIEALALLRDRGGAFEASIYGDALPRDREYYLGLRQQVERLGLRDRVRFYSAIPNDQTPLIYNRHEACVNLSSSGMYDKTIFEAMACGCLTLASNDNLRGQIDDQLIINDYQAQEIAGQMAGVIFWPVAKKEQVISAEAALVKKHSLPVLLTELVKYIQ